MRRAAFLIVALAALALPGSAAAACRPTAAHPFPVILVHGTFANQALSWNALRPLLEADGFCVFGLDYGINATGPMAQSGDTVAAFARNVLAQTGAAKVSFVGHSQGGSLSRSPRAASPPRGRRAAACWSCAPAGAWRPLGSSRSRPGAPPD